MSFLRLRKEAVSKSFAPKPCVVDLHPDRPIARGMAPHRGPVVVARLPADPTFAEIEALGGIVEKHPEGHPVAGDSVWISGEVPRLTEYEEGIIGGMRWVPSKDDGRGEWISDEVCGLKLSFSLHLTQLFSISWMNDTLWSMLLGRV